MKTTPTPAQQSAITTIDRSVGIIAGAGAGKTSVLVTRYRYLLEHAALRPTQILAISFTERAAQELRTRLFAHIPAPLHAELHQATISTFHGCCAQILREHAPAMGLAPHFRLLDAVEAQQLVTAALHRLLLQQLEAQAAGPRMLMRHYGFTTLVQRLGALVQDRWNVQRWFASTMEAPLEPVPEGTPIELAYDTALRALFDLACSACAAVKRHRQVLDYHDLEIFTWQLLETHPEIAGDYQQRYRQLLVDEFQDTNRIQMRLIQQLWSPPDNQLCIVGDPKQSIYRFRGAQVECFRTMLDLIAAQGGSIVTLPENFRSAPPVIAFVNAACPDIPADERLIATQPEDARAAIDWLAIPAARSADERRRAEATAIVAHLQSLVQRYGYRWGDIACLFRTHTSMEPYLDALRGARIPAHRYGGGHFFQQREIQDLLRTVTVLSNVHQGRPDDATLLAWLHSPLGGYRPDDCYRLLYLRTPGPSHLALPETAGPLHRAVSGDPALGPLLARWLAQWPLRSIPELLEGIVADTHYDTVLRTLDPSGHSLANLEKLLTISDAFCRRGDLVSVEQWLQYCRALAQAEAQVAEQPIIPAGDDAVQLLTIHAAKGNEFPVVVLADLEARVPHRWRGWPRVWPYGIAWRGAANEDSPQVLALRTHDRHLDAAEAQRLLYVALTRARLRVVLPMAAEASTGAWGPQLQTAARHVGITPITATGGVADTEAPVMASVAPSADHRVIATAAPGTEPRTDAAPTLPHLVPRTTPTHPSLVHHTVSELEAYDRCPYEYHLRYVQGLPPGPLQWRPPEQLPEQLRGELVHAAIARAASDPSLDLATAAAHELRRRGMSPALAQQPPLAELLAAYSEQREHERGAQQASPIGGALLAPGIDIARSQHELPFRWRVPDATPRTVISGTIDCIDEGSEGWELIDFKTDHITAAEVTEAAQQYTLQMAIYALAATTAGYPLARTTLHFLAPRRAVHTPITPEYLTQAHAHLRTIIATLHATTDTPSPPPQPPCARCVFHRNQLCTHDRLR